MMDNIDESTQLLGASELTDAGPGESRGVTYEDLDRPSFGARARMIVLLALISWAMVIAALTWVFA